MPVFNLFKRIENRQGGGMKVLKFRTDPEDGERPYKKKEKEKKNGFARESTQRL